MFKPVFRKRCFPEQLEIAKVTSLFKRGYNAPMDDYYPISVVPCFSKIRKNYL